MSSIPEEIKREAKKELARRDFWSFEKALYPELFREDRPLLKEMAEKLQWFVDDSSKHYLVMSVPPGHFKTFTSRNFSLWQMGRDETTRIIGVSNSSDLSSMISTQIRDTILGINVGKGGIPYPEIFPDTKIKQGFATKSKWELQGSQEPSYRALSPGAATTGSRADIVNIDDIVKSYAQSLNAQELLKHLEYYKNTLFSRTDGDKYKIIVIMQRWATNDLAGEIINLYGDDVIHIKYDIEDKDGKMLDESILSREKFDAVKKTVDPNVLRANYYQEPINIVGRLYDSFNEWTTLPDSPIKYSNIDVADQGSDYLCAIDWIKVKTEEGTKVYITDIYYSNDKAEITEPELAKMLTADNVTEAEFESNNGGKFYSRNIDREMKKLGNHKTVTKWTPQSSNKEARIKTSSAWVAQNVYMPPNWTSKYPDFAGEVLSYIVDGKNPHDDGVDVLATIFERATGNQETEFWGIR